jgi:PAS domain-containing protein
VFLRKIGKIFSYIKIMEKDVFDWIFTTTESPLLLVSCDGLKVLKANASASRFFGFPGQNLLDRGLNLLINNESKADFNEILAVFENGDTWKKELSFITIRGNIFAHIHGKSVDIDGEFYFLICLKPVQEQTIINEMKQQIELYETIFDNIPAELVIFSSELKYLYLNKANFKKHPELRHWLIGKTNYDYCEYRGLPIDLADRREAWFREIIDSKEMKTLVEEFPQPDGSIVYQMRNMFPYFEDGKVKLLFGCSFDVSDIKRVEAEKRQLIDELTQKNDILTQYSYIIAHDLREPLRNIGSFTNLITRRYSQTMDENAKEYFQFIIDNTLRMNRMLTDMMGFITIPAHINDFHLISLEQVVQDAVANLDTTIKETNATIQFCSLPMVKGSPVHLTQLFQNLIGNAIKFRKETEHPQIHINAKIVKNAHKISIQDNGIGISPDFHEQIFGVFKRLDKQKYEGSGIGLSICQKIVELHGSNISVASEEGNGACFEFELKG